MIGQSSYDRIVIGFHGCDETIRDKVCAGEIELIQSANPYDWLGGGIYFWEHGPQRALDYATRQVGKGKITKPSVVGAVINLRRCLDLLDTAHVADVEKTFGIFKDFTARKGLPLPKNKKCRNHDDALKLRFLDCIVLNWHFRLAKQKKRPFDTARAAFVEGQPVFEGSALRKETHIQVTVRNPKCVVGYFRPR